MLLTLMDLMKPGVLKVAPFQPAAEIIGFRMGELRGLSKWRARYKGIGLDEKLIDNAAEKAGILLIQVERFMNVLSSAVQQVFFYLGCFDS